MSPIKIEIVYLAANTGQDLAQAIQKATTREDFVGIDAFSPWFAGGKHHVILTLTLEQALEDPRGQRYR